MKIKPSYKDRMRELFSFGDDLENWELQTTFSDFVAEFVEFSGNEAEEIRRLQAEEESRFSAIGGAARQGSRVTGLTEQ